MTTHELIARWRASTLNAAESFARLVQSLRERGHDPQGVAYIVSRLVFRMFADDAGLPCPQWLADSSRTVRKFGG